MDAFIDNVVYKFFAVISAIILAFTAVGGLELAKSNEPSTLLTQTSVVEGNRPADAELNNFYKNMEKGFTIPGLKECFIPQGLFYEKENDIFLISGYYKNKVLSSRIVVVDGEGNFVKSVGAISKKGNQAFGHFGGISVFKDNVYVSTTGVTHVLSLSEILGTENNGYATILGELYTDVTCSYTNVCDGILYIGEFVEDNIESKNASQHKENVSGERFYARCNAFILDENGKFGIKKDKIDSSNMMTPDYAFAIPLKTQGMAKLSNGKIVFTASATPVKNSNIYVYSDVTKRAADKTVEVNGSEVPLYICKKSDRIAIYKAPVYIEEITEYADGDVYLISESAADPYRKSTKNPIDFVMKWNINNMGKGGFAGC